MILCRIGQIRPSKGLLRRVKYGGDIMGKSFYDSNCLPICAAFFRTLSAEAMVCSIDF
jgi:hypothetical protein